MLFRSVGLAPSGWRQSPSACPRGSKPRGRMPRPRRRSAARSGLGVTGLPGGGLLVAGGRAFQPGGLDMKRFESASCRPCPIRCDHGSQGSHRRRNLIREIRAIRGAGLEGWEIRNARTSRREFSAGAPAATPPAHLPVSAGSPIPFSPAPPAPLRGHERISLHPRSPAFPNHEAGCLVHDGEARRGWVWESRAGRARSGATTDHRDRTDEET